MVCCQQHGKASCERSSHLEKLDGFSNVFQIPLHFEDKREKNHCVNVNSVTYTRVKNQGSP